MARAGPVVAISAASITMIMAGCAGQLSASSAEAPAVRGTESSALSAPELSCETEAEQLLSPVRVFAAPAENAPEQANLSAGRIIYRCNRWHDWISISYPQEGEPVDCALRTEQGHCAVGWVRGSLETSIFG